MKLVIVESPTKAKTIGKFLGKEFKIESSYGHVRDLPKGKLGVEVDQEFEPKYVTPRNHQKVVTALKKISAKSDGVILATDEDREGEAIAWHLSNALGLDQSGTQRIVFHEITKPAILKALETPRTLNMDLVNAQQARRILDRLVGYKLSPFLWKKVAAGLSAGRVQSVALKLIVEREQEIKAFKPREYWTIETELEKDEKFRAELYKIEDKPIDKFYIDSEGKAKTIADHLGKEKYKVAQVLKKELSRNPYPPFMTSTLQQEASKKLGLTAKKTMFLAQGLYEKGYITYMRTDSLNLSEESLKIAKEWLNKNLGAEYAVNAPRRFKSKSKLAQEAHEAIRPTNPSAQPKDIEGLERGELKLYELIWKRFMASQMPSAIFDSTSIDIEAGKYTLKSTGTMLKFDGFLKVWPTKFEDKELPALQKGDSPRLIEVIPGKHFTEPPARFNEASLIKALESYGIGRPSTYASIISVIQTRNYVTKEERRFKPTEIGEMVNKVLVDNFADIFDVGFTAEMENKLDEIAEGRENWREILKKFYGPFSKKLEEKYEEVKKITVDETTSETCEKCGKPMMVKFSRFGKFLGCSGFPECKNIKKLQKDTPKLTGLKCSKCGEGDIIERRVGRGRARGKIFWGCSRYPKCDFATWEDPTKPKNDTPKVEEEEPEEDSD